MRVWDFAARLVQPPPFHEARRSGRGLLILLNCVGGSAFDACAWCSRHPSTRQVAVDLFLGWAALFTSLPWLVPL